MKIYEINGINIPYSDIKKHPESIEKITQTGSLIPSKLSIDIDNTNKAAYDPDVVGSLFYGADFFGDLLTVYDTDTDVVVWVGNVTNIKKSEKKRTITIETHNVLRDVSQITCVYSSSTNTTAAEHILNILTDVCGIPTAQIDYKSFNNAIAIQTASSAFANISVGDEDNKKAIEVCNSLSRMASCDLYNINNKFYLSQWQAWGGQLGYKLTDNDIITQSVEYYYDDKEIYNSYSVKYDNAGAIATSTGSDAASVLKYGNRAFAIPKTSNDSTVSSEYKILFKSGASWAGALILDRYKYIKRYVEFTTDLRQNYIGLNDQIDMHFLEWIGEPVRVIERTVDNTKKTIDFTCEFLNNPHEYYSRDTTPPLPVSLVKLTALGYGGLRIEWTESDESDHLGYKVFFTTTLGEWYSETCAKYGRSPIDIKSPTISGGIASVDIYGLSGGTKYYVKIISYDTSYNDSDFSNMLDKYIYSDSDNRYYCTGSPASGLYLDATNGSLGTVPDDAVSLYGSAIYGTDVYSYTAAYESIIYRGVSEISFTASTGLYFQYRSSTDGLTFSAWSAEIDASGNNTEPLSGNYIQYRFLWKSSFWSSSDYVIVTNIE